MTDKYNLLRAQLESERARLIDESEQLQGSFGSAAAGESMLEL